MATALTHSFTRKADMLMSTPAAQQFGEPWDIFPDPSDPHEQRNDEGRTEFGVFGPMPSNPAKRARYMLLANYLELAGSGSTMNGASEREKREEEQHFERSVYAHTLHQIDEQIYHVNQEIARVDSQLENVRRELAQHRTRLAGLCAGRDITKGKIAQLNEASHDDAAAIQGSAARLQENDAQHAQARSEIDEKIRLAEEKLEKEKAEFAAQNGFEYDPKTHRFYEVRENGERHAVSIFSRPELMGSRAYLEMERARLELIDLKQQAGQIDADYKDRRRMEEKFLEGKQLSLAENKAEIEKLEVKLAQQEEAIKLEEQRISQLQVTEAQLAEERRLLDIKKAELEQTRTKMLELQENSESIRDNLAYATKLREASHTNRLALFANDPAKLAQENESFTIFQTASAGICSVDPNKPFLTSNFNALQALATAETGTKSKGPAAEAQASAAAVDPVNGDASANAASVADPEKQDPQVADATAEQPAANQDGATQNTPPQQKKAPVNANSGIG